jgi:hypothetical protein
MDSENILLALFLLIDDSEDEEIAASTSAKKRKLWVKPWIQKFSAAGPYETVWKEWREEDPERYRRTLR